VSLNIFVGKSHQIFNTDNLTYQAERAICKAGLFEESPFLNRQSSNITSNIQLLIVNIYFFYKKFL
jgi:hypothetical protein